MPNGINNMYTKLEDQIIMMQVSIDDNKKDIE